MGRRITKGRKGIAYYDLDGYKQFVFDATDTHGDSRYARPILPMRRLLGGLDEINDTSLAADSEQSDYSKIQVGVQAYLKEQGELSGDEKRDKLLVDGVAYSLYSKTGFPKSAGIKLGGLTYGYRENADFIKDVYIWTDMLEQDIEEAYREKQTEIKIIDDTNEENVSDEPVLPSKPTKMRVFSSAVKMYSQDYVILTDNAQSGDVETTSIYIGKPENLDNVTNVYDDSDGSLIYVTDRPKMPYLLYGKPYAQTQQELIENGTFTEEDYAEYSRLKEGALKEILEQANLRFGVKPGNEESGVAFKYPDWQDEVKAVEQTEQVAEEPKHPMYPMYKRYMEAQSEKPQAIVMIRLGDFYEMFGNSATEASKELDLTLTGRDFGLPERVPMCGVPYHAAESYIAKLVGLGYKVAICEQLTDPVKGKMVPRDVDRA